MTEYPSQSLQSQTQTYDIVFCGMGIATCLLLRELDRNSLLHGRTVAIIEPTQHHRAKTLCFWASPESAIAVLNADIIANSWTKGHVPPNTPESLKPLQYFQIRSETLFDKTMQLCQQYSIDIFQEQVQSIQTEGTHLEVTTHEHTYRSIKVFDSRSTNHSIQEGTLLQSFTGFFIELKQGSFLKDTITLMDFEMPQDGATQFMYVLPENDQRGLVECTRFGIEKLDEKVARTHLDNYINRHWGTYSIIEEEHGVIPMSTDLNPSTDTPSIPSLVSIGTRGGAVKPSTGYAFTSMFQHAQDICSDLSVDTPIKTNPRFEFYDRLLIDILCTRPEIGKTIFQELFEHQSMSKVFKFLSEQTSIWEEAVLFMRLSWPPFLVAAGKDFVRRLRFHSELLLLFITLVTTVMYTIQPQMTYLFAGLTLILGMFVVGIPHGALDHRTIGKEGVPQWSLSFHAGYWSVICAMGILWYLSPVTALGLFILTSAWHFGQTDFQHWQIHSPYHLGSFLWGTSVLTILIGSHPTESGQVFTALDVPHYLLDIITHPTVVILAICVSIIAAIWHRSTVWFFSICTLGLTMMLPLPIAFGIYFIGQHSIQAWSHLTNRLKVKEIPIWKEAIPFTGGALFLLLGCIWNPLTFNLQPELLIVIGSCITLPHILCMNTFYRRKNRT